MEQINLKPCPFCGGEAVFRRAFMAKPTLKSFTPSAEKYEKYFLEQEFNIECKSCGYSTRDFIVRIEIDIDNLSLKKSFDENDNVSRVRNVWNRRST